MFLFVPNFNSFSFNLINQEFVKSICVIVKLVWGGGVNFWQEECTIKVELASHCDRQYWLTWITGGLVTRE